MSAQTPFLLTQLDAQGNEVPYSGKYYYEDSSLHLTLQDMFLGAVKQARFRLYNKLTPDEDGYSTFSIFFDFSEAFTFGKDGVRYDTSFANSLRKFIKISVAVGSINSDVTTQTSHEISSTFHVEIDTPIYGILFFRDQSEFNSATTNGTLQRRYIMVPYFPNPGEFISFTISVTIPSVQEENFLEKALGFPVKQAEYKSPVTAAEFSSSLMALQQQHVTGGSADHQMLVTYVGPVDLYLLPSLSGAATYPYIQGMLGRAANRGYIFSDNGIDMFFNVQQPIIFSQYPLSHGFFSSTTTQNYYKGLPTEISTVGGTLSLTPDTSDRLVYDTILELTYTLYEVLSFFGHTGTQPQTEHDAYAAKLYDIVATLFSNYIQANGQNYWFYNPETHTTLNILPSFDAAMSNIWASLFSNFLNALRDAFPATFNTSAPISPKYDYISTFDCIMDYFDSIEDVCDFSYLYDKSIWQRPPTQIVASYQAVRLFYSVFIAMAALHGLKRTITSAPNLTAGQKATFVASLTYFDELSKGLATFFAKHVQPWLALIDETKQSGNNIDLLSDIDSVIFPIFASGASADFVLGLPGTISKQFWHLIQKVYFYRGVFTNSTPMVLTHSQPVQDIHEGVTWVLDDFDGEKSSVTWLLANMSEKESEKLFSLKVSVAAII